MVDLGLLYILTYTANSLGKIISLSARILEIHTGKIHMHFVTSVLYEITRITSNTDQPNIDSNVSSCVLI